MSSKIFVELSQKSDQELKELVIRLKTSVIENRFKALQGELKNTHVFKRAKHLIARIYTIFSQRGIKLLEHEQLPIIKKLKMEEEQNLKILQEEALAAQKLAEEKNKVEAIEVDEVTEVKTAEATSQKVLSKPKKAVAKTKKGVKDKVEEVNS